MTLRKRQKLARRIRCDRAGCRYINFALGAARVGRSLRAILKTHRQGAVVGRLYRCRQQQDWRCQSKRDSQRTRAAHSSPVSPPGPFSGVVIHVLIGLKRRLIPPAPLTLSAPARFGSSVKKSLSPQNPRSSSNVLVGSGTFCTAQASVELAPGHGDEQSEINRLRRITSPRRAGVGAVLSLCALAAARPALPPCADLL